MSLWQENMEGNEPEKNTKQVNMKTRRQHIPKKNMWVFLLQGPVGYLQLSAMSWRIAEKNHGSPATIGICMAGWIQLPKNPRCFPFLQPFSSRKSPRNSCPPGPMAQSQGTVAPEGLRCPSWWWWSRSPELNVPEKAKKPAVMEKFADFDIATFPDGKPIVDGIIYNHKSTL